jgi:hypothetical protein
MASLTSRLLDAVLPRRRDDRRNIEALAARLGASTDDAEWVYRRSRAVGYGAAMLEYEARCRDGREPADATRA